MLTLRTLAEQVSELGLWARWNRAAIKDARARFDAQDKQAH